MSRVYVYALLEEGRKPLRAAARRIEFTPLGGIHAAIEKRESPPDLTETALREQHQIVVALWRVCDPILPVRFGAWLEKDELKSVVASRMQLLRAGFDLVRNKEQMTIRIFRHVVPQDEPVRSRSSGVAYLEDLRNAARPQTSALAEAIRGAVNGLARGERVEGPRGRLQTTMHHLIERGRSHEYQERIDRVALPAEAAEAPVVSGPWPPFAFAPDVWP
jgi:hypothetical protein